MKPLALISKNDRDALELVLDKYRAQGWDAESVSISEAIDKTTLAYELRAQSGIRHAVRLQKYKGGFFSSLWLVMPASTSQGTDQFQARGFAVVTGLGPAINEAEKMMAGNLPQFESLDLAMKKLGH